MTNEADPFFQPISAMELARFAGVPTFMRLPSLNSDDPRFNDVDIGLLGVPWDGGTTNRPGARHGPRQMRDLSTMIRATPQLRCLVGSEMCIRDRYKSVRHKSQ